MFLTESENRLSDDYLRQGYVVRPVADAAALEWMREQFLRLIGETLGVAPGGESPADTLNHIHRRVPVERLNEFRLKIIRGFNAVQDFRKNYFQVARPYLETLVGNELAMQRRINLSIQFPDDDSSLLPIHADTWSGDSPFETVVWLPLVDCYGSKAMFLLPPDRYAKLERQFADTGSRSSEDLYRSIEGEVSWLEVRYGEVLVFNQTLPHGNRINRETETRWSMNCRFKGVFTPYGDKKIAEFFEPITLRAASRIGMDYSLPKIS